MITKQTKHFSDKLFYSIRNQIERFSVPSFAKTQTELWKTQKMLAFIPSFRIILWGYLVHISLEQSNSKIWFHARSQVRNSFSNMFFKSCFHRSWCSIIVDRLAGDQRQRLPCCQHRVPGRWFLHRLRSLLRGLVQWQTKSTCRFQIIQFCNRCLNFALFYSFGNSPTATRP